MPVQLLDGMFLAVRANVLQRSGVRFDPGFAFHHVDLISAAQPPRLA